MPVTELSVGPSQHRGAVRRALCKAGALSLGQGEWAVPDVPVFAAGEEQSLERPRRWHRYLSARVACGVPEAADAGRRLEACAAVREDYAERVFAARDQTPGARR
ncbi:hypothetical protein SAMN05216533_8297 [Streptomyces sp. Ag109_O5-10]|nr:hypothetical protein SAMN05216533_8297 [Streptomyces sp. Ag109_O5-10]